MVTSPKEIAPFQIVFTNQASSDVATPRDCGGTSEGGGCRPRQLYAGQQRNWKEGGWHGHRQAPPPAVPDAAARQAGRRGLAAGGRSPGAAPDHRQQAVMA